MKLLALLCCAMGASLLWTAAAAAAELQPAKPVPENLYSGRWYEIARTPNRLQNNCEGSTSDFLHWNDGDFQFVLTCHKGSAQGPTSTLNAHGHVLPESDNTKMKLGFFGGFVTQEYWIVDRADDDSWAIMATPTGRYVWLLSRSPILDPKVKSRAMARMEALGFDCSRLAYPLQQAELTAANEGGTR